MNQQKSKHPIGKKLVAVTAAVAIGLGITMTGCQPDEFEAPEEPGEELPPPTDTLPEPAPIPEPDEDADN